VNDEEIPPEHRSAIDLKVHLPATTLSGWAATSLIGLTIVSAVTLFLVLVFTRPMLVELRGEIRVLQLYVSDVQDVMIRQGVAHREDFPYRFRPEPSKGADRDPKP
jgi:hypothetical protein